MSLKSKIFGLGAALTLSACDNNSDKVIVTPHNAKIDLGTRTAMEGGIVRRKLEACLNEDLREEERIYRLGYSSVEGNDHAAFQTISIGRTKSCDEYNFIYECGNKVLGNTEDTNCSTSMSYRSSAKDERIGDCGYTQKGYFSVNVTCYEEAPQRFFSPLDQQIQVRDLASPQVQNVAVDYHNEESSNQANP